MQYIGSAIIVFAYIAFTGWCYHRFNRRHTALQIPSEQKIDSASWLIVYASQSGFSEALAQKTHQQLAQSGVNSHLIIANQLKPELLTKTKGALFIVSTYGEGEAPDNGSRLIKILSSVNNTHTSFAVLALGDSQYRYYCAFGRVVYQSLLAAGGVPFGDLIEVDQRDPAALRHWQYYLGKISGATTVDDWQVPQYENWQLLNRTCINPQGVGLPAYYLRLKSLQPQIWQAGDLIELGPRNSTALIKHFIVQLDLPDSKIVKSAGQSYLLVDWLAQVHLPTIEMARELIQQQGLDDFLTHLRFLPHREYSIASIPEAGTLDILVRQARTSQGELGLGSGWLTAHAAVGGEIALRIRENRRFHSPADQSPLILIGNGTGIAGLRAHLQARQNNGVGKNWLLFGERSPAHDHFFKDEQQQLLAEGILTYADFAFSRAEPEQNYPRYVQDLLPVHRDRLKEWVAAGAAIYVCGSLKGMASGVHENLVAILGERTIEALLDQGRYCRDVY